MKSLSNGELCRGTAFLEEPKAAIGSNAPWSNVDARGFVSISHLGGISCSPSLGHEANNSIKETLPR